MAKLNGTLYAVYSGSDKVLHTVNASLNLEQDLSDVTNKESAGWAEHINGLRNWSIDFSGKYDETGSGVTPNEIMAAIIARTADTVIQFKPTTGATAGWTGNGTFKSIKIDADQESLNRRERFFEPRSVRHAAVFVGGRVHWLAASLASDIFASSKYDAALASEFRAILSQCSANSSEPSPQARLARARSRNASASNSQASDSNRHIFA